MTILRTFRVVAVLAVFLALASGLGAKRAAAGTLELSLEDGTSVTVSRVVISNGRGSLVVDVADGMMRRIETSVQLGGIQSLGTVPANHYPASALGPETRVGAAWRDGELLLIVIDEPLVRLEALTGVTLFNDRWSYRLLGQTKPIELNMAEDIPRFGGVPTVQRWLRLLPDLDDVRLLTAGTRRNPLGLLSPNARARSDVEALSSFFVGSAHRSQQQLGIVIYPSQAAK